MDIDVPSGRGRGGKRSRTDADADADPDRGRLARLRGRLGRLFALRSFALALVGTVAGLLLGNLVPLPLGPVGSALGVLVAGFAGGLVLSRAYVEWALAGGLVGGLSVLLDHVALSLAAGVGVNIAVVGAAAGGAAGLVGHYFGRDLRAGLTKSVA